MKSLSLAAAIFLLFSQLTQGQRAAFLIGINNYPNGNALTKCVTDADSVGYLMKSFGFEVHVDSNLSTDQFKRTITSWLPIMKRNKDIVVYFSGHGFDISSDQFLEGNNFDDKNFLELNNMTVDLYYLIDGLQKVESMPDAKLSKVVIFLDACRDFPTQAQMESVRKLIRLQVPTLRNSYVGYAALPGGLASSGIKVSEGGGKNSLFTQALLGAIEKTPNGQLTSGLNNDIKNLLHDISQGSQRMQEVDDLADFQFQLDCTHCIVAPPLAHRCFRCDVRPIEELVDTVLLGESYKRVADFNRSPLRSLGFNADLSESYGGALSQSREQDLVRAFLSRHEYADSTYDLEKSYVVYTFKLTKLQNMQLYLNYRHPAFYDQLAQALSINREQFPGVLFLGSLDDKDHKFSDRPPFGRGVVFGRLAEYDYAIIELGEAKTIMHDPDRLHKFEKIFQKLEVPKTAAYQTAKQ